MDLTVSYTIVHFLKIKENENYIGVFTFNFEKGELLQFTEANWIKYPVPHLSEEEAFKSIREQIFPYHSGTTVVVFKEGKIITGSYIKKWQGEYALSHLARGCKSYLEERKPVHYIANSNSEKSVLVFQEDEKEKVPKKKFLYKRHKEKKEMN